MDLPAEPIVGNKKIENAAIRFVIDQERRFGRNARDTRHRGAAADIESDGRTIEPRPETAPLFAAALTAQQRSRPGSKPPYRTINGVVVDGIEDFADIAGGVA